MANAITPIRTATTTKVRGFYFLCFCDRLTHLPTHRLYLMVLFAVEITMRGRIDPTTGMVINIKDLKECMQVVLENLDHRNLDKDVEYFFTKPSTTENLAVYIWTEFQKAYIAHPIGTMSNARLYRVKICETDSNYVEYMGEGEED
jgi:6-pyruvoyltetrahydropterin/6-carboxytetrahydropterin synthase